MNTFPDSESIESHPRGESSLRPWRLCFVAIMGCLAYQLLQRFWPDGSAPIEMIVLAWIAMQPPEHIVRPIVGTIYFGIMCAEPVASIPWVGLSSHSIATISHPMFASPDGILVVKMMAISWALLRMIAILGSLYVIDTDRVPTKRFTIQKVLWLTLAISVLCVCLRTLPRSIVWPGSSGESHLSASLVHAMEVAWHQEVSQTLALGLMSLPLVGGVALTTWCFARGRWRLLLLPSPLVLELGLNAAQATVQAWLSPWAIGAKPASASFQTAAQVICDMCLYGASFDLWRSVWSIGGMVVGILALRWTGIRWVSGQDHVAPSSGMRQRPVEPGL